jgi:hypothetical protein
MANAIPRIPQIRVGVVLDPGLAGGAQIFTQVLTRDLEQWTNDLTPLRVDAGKAGHARAANQLEQERFGLVVACVADGDSIGTNLHG